MDLRVTLSRLNCVLGDFHVPTEVSVLKLISKFLVSSPVVPLAQNFPMTSHLEGD